MKKFIWVVLAIIISIVTTSAALMSGNQKIVWTPGVLEVTVFPGTTTLTTAEIVGPALSDTSLFITPGLFKFLSIHSTGFASVVPNQTYSFPFRFDVPLSTTIGTYEGTVHVREGKRTVPEPLKVIIHVVAPSSTTVPGGPSEPSPDRIVRDAEGQKVVKDEIDVMLDFETPDPASRIVQIAQSTGAVIVGAIPATLTYQLRYPVSDLAQLEPIRLQLEGLPDVDAASHHYLSEGPLAAIPDDTEYDSWDEASPAGNNWGLEFIKAPSAWDINTGDPSVVVGVLDFDIDSDHGDLNDNVAAKIGPRIPDTGHGTHVAGTISAEGNNNKGVTGVCWDCSLRLYELSSGSSVMAQQSMVQAVNEGARIVNMSLQWIDNNQCGTAGTATTLQKVKENNDVLGRAVLFALRENKDVLWVFAAGNECRDAKFASPASLTNNFPLNTIAIASINEDGGLRATSNFGDLVTVAAPGENILSTMPRSCFLFVFCSDQYGEKSGTSMAAPHVSGLAALVRAEHPDFSASQVKSCILSAAQSQGASISGHDFKVINAPAAVTCAGVVDLPDKVDMVFSLDLTGSMGGEVDRVKAEIQTIISRLRTEVAPGTDFRFGVVSYEDYAGFFDSRSCGSSYQNQYGDSPDSPFRINQSLTSDAAAVAAAINSLVLGSGADFPESYGRVFWELGQNDTGASLGWRTDALKLVVNFADDVPHDTNLNEGVSSPPLFFADTGIDPGRNNVIDCGGDDIDFQDDALVALSSKEIRLLHIDSSGNTTLAPYWQFWVSQTGGAFAAINPDGTVPGGLDLTDLIISLLGLIPPSASLEAPPASFSDATPKLFDRKDKRSIVLPRFRGQKTGRRN